MTLLAPTLDGLQGLAPATRQWRAEALQMVNWGGFEGHHKVEFAGSATLLSGASGTGKSTLLDAYVALMMDSNTPFNGASNDTVTGRARGSEQRNVLSYVRGKIDSSREAGTGQLRDEVLRGHDASTWSGVAMTWRNDHGERFTALRLYFAPISATSLNDVGKHLATVDRAFNLSDVAEFAADRFPHRSMSARFPGLIFHDSYQTFAAGLHTRLGIGAGGDGAKALKLLARIQGGRQVTTVDGLYKTMVLEEPKTFQAADRAVSHFDDLQASYETMKSAEAQVRVLRDIAELHRAMEAAEVEAELIDTFRVQSSDVNTPFALWWRQVEAGLLDMAVKQNRDGHRSAVEGAERDKRAELALKGQISDIKEQQRASGGDALDTLERTLAELAQKLADTLKARTTFELRTELLSCEIDTQMDFDSLKTASDSFMGSFPRRLLALEDQRDQTLKEAHPLTTRLDDLGREFDSLKGREGLVPQDLHAARMAVARALGVEPDQLPFVAELVDMAPEHEAWRQAAELALGGFAVTMLIDEQRLSEARRNINSITMRRRLNFEGAHLHQDVHLAPGTDVLPGRFITKDSPFTGWLMNALMSKFRYVCVEGPGALDTTNYGLTITGQTKQRRRGAHGGHGAPRVIGFSNAGRLKEIEVESVEIEGQLIELAKAQKAAEAQREALSRHRDAHLYVTGVTWAGIDVHSVKGAIHEQEATVERLLRASDVLKQLKKEEQKLVEGLERVQRDLHGAEAAQERLGKEHEELVTRQDTVNDHLWEMQEDASVVLTEDQSDRLTTEFAHIDPDRSLSSFERSVANLRRALGDQTSRLRKDADQAARILSATFEGFQMQWPRPNLGTGVESYDGYREILDELVAEGLHERRAKFSREVSEWSGVDLLRLHGAFEESIEEIESRLGPVNEILERLPFGANRDRLHINLRRQEGKDIGQFRRELKLLASGTTDITTDEEIEARFKRVRRFIDRIRKSEKSSQREYLIDVRRHVYIEAERRDTSGRQLGVYTSLGGKSGGETQELVAFIVGAALRYQLGDADLDRPGYAPVFLDEGFVKSDSEFAGRAVSAWKGLGFQLIIGAPNDKVTAIEPYMDLLLQVTKNGKNHSHVTVVIPATPAPTKLSG